MKVRILTTVITVIIVSVFGGCGVESESEKPTGIHAEGESEVPTGIHAEGESEKPVGIHVEGGAKYQYSKILLEDVVIEYSGVKPDIRLSEYGGVVVMDSNAYLSEEVGIYLGDEHFTCPVELIYYKGIDWTWELSDQELLDMYNSGDDGFNTQPSPELFTGTITYTDGAKGEVMPDSVAIRQDSKGMNLYFEFYGNEYTRSIKFDSTGYSGLAYNPDGSVASTGTNSSDNSDISQVRRSFDESLKIFEEKYYDFINNFDFEAEARLLEEGKYTLIPNQLWGDTFESVVPEITKALFEEDGEWYKKMTSPDLALWMIDNGYELICYSSIFYGGGGFYSKDISAYELLCYYGMPEEYRIEGFLGSDTNRHDETDYHNHFTYNREAIKEKVEENKIEGRAEDELTAVEKLYRFYVQSLYYYCDDLSVLDLSYTEVADNFYLLPAEIRTIAEESWEWKDGYGFKLKEGYTSSDEYAKRVDLEEQEDADLFNEWANSKGIPFHCVFKDGMYQIQRKD